MPKLYKRLRMRMIEMDVDQQDIADKLGCCRTSVSQRMRGHCQWTMQDVYRICKFLNIPYEEIHLFFPEGGKSDKSIGIIT